ncbi:MAG: PilZ domain-containing protein [Thermoleophilia bacterium]
MANVDDLPRSAGTVERRSEPRIAVGVPVTVTQGLRRASGRVIDAGEHGVLVELEAPLAVGRSDAVITLTLPSAGPHEADAQVVRAGPGPRGGHLVAMRVGPVRPVAPRERTRRVGGRAAPQKPRRPRSRVVMMAELRALGTRAYELAVIDPAEVPPPALNEWLTRLAEDLGVWPPPPARSARDLLMAIRDVTRAAREAPLPR